MTFENFSIDSEQSVIGGILLEPYRIDDLPCTEQDFYANEHRVIFNTIVELAEKNKLIDAVTVAESLEAKNQLNECGGIGYIFSLAQNVLSAANIKHYASIVKDKALKRELIKTASEIIESVGNSSDSAEQLLANAESAIYAIGDKRDTAEPVEIDSAVGEAVGYLSNLVDGLSYLETGLTDLDQLIGGLKPGALYVVAARPSMGKTALMTSIAHHVSKNVHCYIATLEMPRREIAIRLMAINASLNVGDIKSWSDNEYNMLAKASESVRNLKITIDDTEGLSLTKLRARARRIKRRKGLGCLFVDYLQLMTAKAETREREIASISAGLKSLAKELDIPVVVLAQLNRDCDKRLEKRPLTSDLRESGAIEQDADVIVMLYRDEVVNKESNLAGIAELLVRKNRHGRIGDVYVQYQKETMHFRNAAVGWQFPAISKQIKRTRDFDS